MLRPRWRKVLQDFWGNKTRTLLVVISIAVGIFAIGVIISTEAILSRDLHAGYRAIYPASAVLTTEPFDNDQIETVRHMPEVGEAEGRRILNARLNIGGDMWRDIILITIDDYNDMRVNQVQPAGGDWPPPKHTLLIERSGVDFAQATIGDTVLIKIPGGKERVLGVVGLAHDLAREPAFLESTVYGYITFDTLEWLGQPRDYNELHITVAEHPTNQIHIQQVADAVSNKIEKGGRTVLIKQVPPPLQHPMDDILQALLVLLGVLGVLSLLLSGFLVTNTITALLTQQIKAIGIMKTIGARARQLIELYIVLVLLFGGIALVIALPFSLLGTYALTSYLASLFNFDLTTFRAPLHAFALQSAIALLMPILVALYPIIVGARITVLEAINAHRHGTGHARTGFMDRIVAHGRGMPRPLLLSLRNTVRQKGRLALTLTTLTLGGTIFVSVVNVRTSLFRTLDEVMQLWQFDVWVVFDRSYRLEMIEREPLEVPGVVTAEGWGVTFVRRIRDDDSEGEDIVLYAPPATTNLIDPVMIEGRWLLPEDKQALVVSSQVISNEPDIGVGSTIHLKLDARETTWHVVGIVRSHEMAAYVNYPHYAYMARDAGRANVLAIETIRSDDDAQSAAIQALEAHFSQLGLHVSSMLPMNGERAEGENAFNILVVLLSLMAALLAIVGGLGLMGTMSINVLERTREIGVMRAIGATNGAIMSIVIVEGICIALLSWLLGAMLAFPLSQFLDDTVGRAFLSAPLSTGFSMSGILLWLILVNLLATLASFLPAWHAARLTVRDALAYE